MLYQTSPAAPHSESSTLDSLPGAPDGSKSRAAKTTVICNIEVPGGLYTLGWNIRIKTLPSFTPESAGRPNPGHA
jgi:hypothetical protein